MAAELQFKVSDEAPLGLNLRTKPVVKPSTKIALLPMGHLVIKKAESPVTPWWEVSTMLDGQRLEGFVNSDFLIPAANFVPPQSQSRVVAVHLPNANNTPIMRTNERRAHPLNEPDQPTRNLSASPADKGKALGELIKWLNVDKHIRYLPKPGTTFCNIYSYDYCFLAGAYLPRVWWTDESIAKLESGQSVSPIYGQTVEELTANRLFNWFKRFGTHFGWNRTFDLTRLQGAANEGKLAIICAQRADLSRSGHICPVVPETSTQRAIRSSGLVTKPLQSQAGRENFKYKPWVWWMSSQYRDFGFWIHD